LPAKAEAAYECHINLQEVEMKKVFSGIAVAALIGGSAAYADVHPGIQGLNELLIQKGIITKEELEAQAKKHSLNIRGYIQFQGTAIENNDVTDDEDGFRIRRAKLSASGNAYENVKFKLEADFAGTAPKLDDAYIEDDHLPYLTGRVGQFKAPFGREYLTSATEILTIERSEVTNQITPGRDIGIMFQGKLADNKLHYYVGAFNGGERKGATTYSVGSYNGAGQNKTHNDNDQLMYVGRLVAKPATWAEIGINALASHDGKGGTNVDRTSYGVDFQLRKPERGCTLQGEYLVQNGEGKAIDSDGFYIQAAHFFVPKHLEGVIKYEEYNTENDLSTREDDIRWATIGLNFYIFGNHDAKLMANYIFKGEKGDSYDNDTLLARLQLRF
jgi:hypothetical protein